MKSTPIRALLLLVLLWILLFGFRLIPADMMAPMMPHPSPALADSLRRALYQPYFHVGDLAVTPVVLLKVIVFLAFLTLLSGMVRRFVRDSLLTRTAMAEGDRYALGRVAGYLVFFVGLLVGIQSLGVNLNSLLVLGGAVGVGIGLGLQQIANNFVSGLILLVERPIKLGDRVEVGNVNGDVVRIAGRSTWVRTNDNVVIVVPNSEFVSARVTNWTANDPQVRFSIPVRVAYGTDPEQVRAVLSDVARRHPGVLSNPAPDVLFAGLGENGLNFELRVWTVTMAHRPRDLMSDLYFAVLMAFQERSIRIPIPQRDLHLRSASAPIAVTQASS